MYGLVLCELECCADEGQIVCWQPQIAECVFVCECELDGFAGLFAEGDDIE